MEASKHLFINIPQISAEDQKKYRGMNVAIVEEKVVAAGYTSVEVAKKAQELFPDKPTHEILIADIPLEDFLIL